MVIASSSSSATASFSSSSASSSLAASASAASRPIVSFRATVVDPKKCPFSAVVVSSCGADGAGAGSPAADAVVAFELRPGSALRLHGRSGVGKTTLASCLAGLYAEKQRLRLSRALGLRIDVDWRDDKNDGDDDDRFGGGIPEGERVGCLFQSTTLIDSLSVAGNLAVAIDYCPSKKANNNSRKWPTVSGTPSSSSSSFLQREVKDLLEAVGLDYARDADKRPRELSGGMARRASLALQLAQRKHVIVLDEPFTGLDERSATAVARQIRQLRASRGVAVVLICHEEAYAKEVLGDDGTTIELEESTTTVAGGNGANHDRTFPAAKAPNLFGRYGYERFLAKLFDYTFYSLPLILLTFTATGLAIAMLSSDILRRVDVTDKVLEVVGKEVQPLLKMVTGEEEPSPLYMMMIKSKVRGMLNTQIPQAKATLYALGMAKLFVLEIGPLLTAILLAGRVGGSYAGEVATMESTHQNALLKTLGIRPRAWTFRPSLCAALIASPFLTVVGTVVSLYLGGIVCPRYGICEYDKYRQDVVEAAWSDLRIRGFNLERSSIVASLLSLDFITTTHPASSGRYPWYAESVIEITTYPPIFLLMKAMFYVVLILVVAEACGRWKGAHQQALSPRGVPGRITSSVVIGSLTVIVADWGFSQLLLKRY